MILLVLTFEVFLMKMVVPAVLGLVGTGGAIFLVKHTNKKVDAETANIIINSAEQIVSMQNKAFERIDKDAAELRLKVTALEEKLEVVTSDNVKLRAEVSILSKESTDKSVQILSLQNHMLILEDEVRRLGGSIPPRPSGLQNFFTNKK